MTVFPGSIPPDDDYVMPDITGPSPEDLQAIRMDRDAWWALSRDERARRMAEAEDLLP